MEMKKECIICGEPCRVKYCLDCSNEIFHIEVDIRKDIKNGDIKQTGTIREMTIKKMIENNKEIA